MALAYPVSTVAIAIGSFFGGGALSVFGALWNTTMQREIPAEVISRVSAYDWFGSLVFLPLGMAAVGPLADSFGTTVVLVTAAGLTVLLIAAVLLVPSVTQLRVSEST